MHPSTLPRPTIRERFLTANPRWKSQLSEILFSLLVLVVALLALWMVTDQARTPAEGGGCEYEMTRDGGYSTC